MSRILDPTLTSKPTHAMGGRCFEAFASSRVPFTPGLASQLSVAVAVPVSTAALHLPVSFGTQ